MKGPWKSLRRTLKGYSRRIEYVEKRTAYDLAIAFKNKLLELAPKGDEYSKYLESIEVVQVTGVRGTSVFAVVSMGTKEAIGDVLDRDSERENTVVYVDSSAAAEQNVGIELLVDASPWPITMLPSGIPRNDVVLLHRQVSPEEADWAKEKTRDFIKRHEGEFRSYGFVFGPIENEDLSVRGMESMSDYLTLALRSELGINAKQVPHWRPALKWVKRNMMNILEDDEEILLALQDPTFRRHTFDNKLTDEKMEARVFSKKTSKFRSMVRSA